MLKLQEVDVFTILKSKFWCVCGYFFSRVSKKQLSLTFNNSSDQHEKNTK